MLVLWVQSPMRSVARKLANKFRKVSLEDPLPEAIEADRPFELGHMGDDILEPMLAKILVLA